MNLPNVQSIPENPLLQVHDPLSQVPSFLQASSASHINSGHVPSLPNATPPGQGVEEVVGLPLNTYIKELSSIFCSNYKICILDSRVESVQDFLIKLDMKPCMHLVEISIFSLNHVIIRLTKIMKNLLEHLKICTFN